MSGLRYTRSGDASVVFRSFDGAAGRDLVVITGATMPMDAWLDDRVGQRMLDGLRRVGRVVVFDRRGIGLSDPLDRAVTMLRACWSEDLLAVIDAAEMSTPDVVALNMVDPAVLLAARAPERVRSVVAYEPNVPWCAVGSDGLDQAVAAEGMHQLQEEDEVDIVGLICPTRADEPGFRTWFVQAGQLGASPAMARRMYAPLVADEIAMLESAYRDLVTPMIVLRRRRASLLSDDVIEKLFPGVAQLDLPGRDNLFVGEALDALLAEISRFVVGEVRLPEPTRMVTAILFTDLVDSTRRAATVGDERWRSLLTEHDGIVRRIVEHSGGRLVKSTGDGVVGLLPSASSGLRSGRLIRAALAEHGLDVRVGLHIGDVDGRGDDVSGLAVNIAARLMAQADAGEILASESVALAAAGEGWTFVAREPTELKGLSGTWVSYALDGEAPGFLT
jgi:class 3 adenylate cyclase